MLERDGRYPAAADLTAELDSIASAARQEPVTARPEPVTEPVR